MDEHLKVIVTVPEEYTKDGKPLYLLVDSSDGYIISSNNDKNTLELIASMYWYNGSWTCD